MFHILLPVDSREERAERAAETILSLPSIVEEVQVTILNVEPDIDLATTDRVDAEKFYDEEDYPKSVEIAKKILENAGYNVSTRRALAEPSEAILEVADEIDADWIIMAGRRRSPVGKVLFGSVAQSVILDAEIPVTMAMQHK